jgi:hypothetical protein
MRPLLTRLRDPSHAENSESSLGDLCREAAAEIERLQYVIDLARTGLLRVERLSEETRAAITQAHG